MSRVPRIDLLVEAFEAERATLLNQFKEEGLKVKEKVSRSGATGKAMFFEWHFLTWHEERSLDIAIAVTGDEDMFDVAAFDINLIVEPSIGAVQFSKKSKLGDELVEEVFDTLDNLMTLVMGDGD